MCSTVLVLLLFAVGCSVADDRDGRGWFDRSSHTVTRLVTEIDVVTELLPSSCVVVQTSLPSCRHLRAVNDIQPAKPSRIMQTQAPYARQNQGWKPIIQPSNPLRQNVAPQKATPPVGRTPAVNSSEPGGFFSNWNIFGFGGPKEVVVTSTVRETFTTKLMDPNTVVTFSVKGCRPSRLPFDLPECNSPKTPIMETRLPEMPTPEEIKAVPAVAMDPGLIVMAPIQLVPNMKPITVGEIKESVKEPAKEVVHQDPVQVEKEEKVVGMKEEEKGEVEIEEDPESQKIKDDAN